jgi:hypothetical protein
MLSSAVRTFTDPEDFAAAIRAWAVDLTITGRGRFAAKIIRIDLQHLWMQRLSDSLAQIAHSERADGRVYLAFQTRPGPGLTWNGISQVPTRRWSASCHLQRSDARRNNGWLPCLPQRIRRLRCRYAACQFRVDSEDWTGGYPDRKSRGTP